MKRFNILPEHIPGGERFSAEDLEPMNEVWQSKKMLIMTAIMIPILVIVMILIAFIPLKGAIGYTLKVVLFIGFPALIVFVLTRPGRLLKKEMEKEADLLGISAEDIGAACQNCINDRRAWGEPCSQIIRYRFRCRKCKTESDWIEYVLTSCTEDTLREKLEEFKRQITVKRRFYDNKTGIAKYSLERQCPHCGALQRKHPPRAIWTILSAVVITFVLEIFFETLKAYIPGLQALVYNSSVLTIQYALLFLSPFIGGIIYLVLRDRNRPEYEIESNKDRETE